MEVEGSVKFSQDIVEQSYYFKKKVVKNRRNILHIISVDSLYSEHKRYAKHCG